MDIASESVGAAFALSLPGEAPRILYETRVRLPKAADDTSAALLRSLSQGLAEATGALLKDGIPSLSRATGTGRVDQALISFSSPWQETRIEKALRSARRPFPVTRSLVTELFKEAEGKVTIPEGAVIADRVVVRTRVDGYRLAKPLGRRGKEVSVTVAFGLVPKNAYDLVLRHIASCFRSAHIRATVLPVASSFSLARAFPYERNFVHIDVSRVASDVSLIHGGALSSAKVLPTGSQDICDGKAGDWCCQVEDALRELAKEEALPQTILVTADDRQLPECLTALRGLETYKIRLGDRPFTVLSLTPVVLAEHVVRGDGPADPMLELLALYAALAEEELAPGDE